MKIYYSAPINYTDYLNNNDIKYLLFSIHNTNVEKYLKNNEWMVDGERYLMIDNGAFSAWNASKEIITIEKYTQYCLDFYEKYKNKFKDIFFIGLDNIPGKRNHKPTKDQINNSCKITFENYEYMLSKGVKNVLPVVHQFEDVKWVTEYENCTDYICLSPANDQSNKSRSVWLDEVYSVINPNTKTHGLAVTGKILLEKYPWYTVDSISWKQPFLFGQVFRWDFYDLKKYSAKKFKFENACFDEFKFFSSLLNEELTSNDKAYLYADYHLVEYKKLEKYITELWKKRGVNWNE